MVSFGDGGAAHQPDCPCNLLSMDAILYKHGEPTGNDVQFKDGYISMQSKVNGVYKGTVDSMINQVAKSKLSSPMVDLQPTKNEPEVHLQQQQLH